MTIIDIEFPNIKWRQVVLEPNKISEKNLYVFHIPTDSNVHSVIVKASTPDDISCSEIIEWIYGDKVIIDKKNMISLSTKMSIDKIQRFKDYYFIDKIGECLADLEDLEESIDYNDLYIKKKDNITIDMNMFSMCSEIRIKMVDYPRLTYIHNVKIIINKRQKIKRLIRNL